MTEIATAPPYAALTPSSQALEWAKRTTEEFARGIDTLDQALLPHRMTRTEPFEEFLGHLYAPGLPELIGECDRLVLDHAPEQGWRHLERISPLAEGTLLREVVDRHDGGLRTRLLLWFMLNAVHPRPAAVDPKGYPSQYFSRFHGHGVRTLTEEDPHWDAPTLSLLLFAEAHGLVGEDIHMDVCEQVADDVLGPCVRQLQKYRARCQEQGMHLFGFEHNRPDTPGRTLLLLLRLGAHLEAGYVLPEGDPFGDALRALEPGLADHPGLAELFVFLLIPPGARPAPDWREALRTRLAALSDAQDTVRRLIEVVLRTPRAEARHHYAGGRAYFPLHVHNIVNGLVWAVEELAAEPDTWSSPLLERLAVFTGTGPGGSKVLRSERTALACVRVLVARGTDEEVAALARIRARVKKKTLLKMVDSALGRIADRLGITGEELLERSVPDFGLGRDGNRTAGLGEHPVTLKLAADGSAALGFVSAKGRPAASPPAALRTSHPDEVKALRAELKELRQAVAAERARLETILAEGRVLDAASWARYYLDHPVTGALARRLLWEVSEDGRTWVCGLPEADADHWRLVDPTGVQTAHTSTLDGGARVRLWHPVRSRPETVQRWREHLTGRELAQPFKQVYREIYLLTPAEETTRVYSNRFAAHILRYGQAKALLNGRGWSVHALGGWDGGDHGTAERLLTDRGSGTSWNVHLDIALADDEFDPVRHCGTDQVRFLRAGEREPAPLAEVPAIVLSEAMRDVDLAVGVTSIAADPQWVDRGERAHVGYWRKAAFGELTENALVRREALERLLPRLRVADRLEIDGRFLRVRGDLRSYRIHLGSANVLMEPDDAYLCVVPSGKAKGPGVFLPFEEDGGRLAVILSKALMLARDGAIEDESITGQIRRGLDG